nr:hypothetical protein [Vampirovibrio sp.]
VRLDRVDFISANQATQIIFHAEKQMPYKTVSADSDRLVIDVDQVNTNQTVRTNFSGSGNISHVIIQPLSNEKLRLIVRGNHLSKPMIRFEQLPGTEKQTATQAVAQKMSSRLPETALTNLPLNVSAKTRQVKTPVKTVTSVDGKLEVLGASTAGPQTLEQVSVNQAAENRQALDLFAEDHTHSAAYTPGDTEGSTTPAVDSYQDLEEDLWREEPGEEIGATRPAAQQTDALGLGGLNSLMDMANTPIDTEMVLKTGILVSLLTGLGLFLRHKLRAQQQASQLGEYADTAERAQEATNGPVRFSDIADSVRRDEALNENNAFVQPTLGQSNVGQDRVNAKRSSAPVGLSALMNKIAGDPPSPSANLTNQLPQPRVGKNRAMNRSSAVTPPPAGRVDADVLEKKLQSLIPPPKRQALGNYLKQASSPKAVAGNKPRASQTQQAITPAVRKPQVNGPMAQRSSMISEPVQTKVKPNRLSLNRANDKDGPLPDNPEVLNFLRSVADYMEQDGRTQMAQTIHKSLKST